MSITVATTALHPAASTYRSTIYEWVTTTDHKKIGAMYIVNSFIFFFIGGLLALGVRVELAQPGLQFVTDQTYNELFTMHATFMIFLFVIPMLAGFGNYIVPLQIGAPDMAFPRINALSLWMLPLGGILLLLIALIFRTMEAFKAFDLPFIMSTASVETVAITLYQMAFQGWDTGRASALAYIVLIVVLAITNLYVKYLNKVKER